MFLCSNDLVGTRLAGLPRRGAVRCAIPKLPLTPAVYSLSLIVRRKGVIRVICSNKRHKQRQG